MTFLMDIRRSYRDFRGGFGGTTLRGIALFDRGGNRIGHVERLTVFPDRLRIEGWADAERIVIRGRGGDDLASTRPHISRSDVRMSLQCDHDRFGFVLNLPGRPDGLILVAVRDGGRERATVLPAVTLRARLRSELCLNCEYLRTLIGVAPDAIRWLRTSDPAARRRIGVAFRGAGQNERGLNVAALSAPALPDSRPEPITIIMPVYQGLELIDPVMTRIRNHTDLPWHLIVIEDASPDPGVITLLRRWQDELTAERMTLLQNPQNLGFVGSVNRGFEQALQRGHDVVLLNSDAFVGRGWSSRLLQPIRADRSIASVTPMSNDAEIANVPEMTRPVVLEHNDVDAIDAVAAKLTNSAALAQAPTGVGFCMAMNIEVLRQLPLFDTAFGRGYGEEVDWCRRAAALGRRNMLMAGVFVEHRGGVSFGSKAKQDLLVKNGAIITRRYPRYDQQVQDFIRADPLRIQRMILGIALAATRAHRRGWGLGVFLGHPLGGGAETYLEQRLQREIHNTGYAVVIRTQLSGDWQIELHRQEGRTKGLVSHGADILRMFDHIRGLNIVYSCGVGAVDPLMIPDFLCRLASRPHSRIEVAFNDFFPISPSYTLLDSHGIFDGLPLDKDDPAHRFITASGQGVSLEDWQTQWTRLVDQAEKLTVFSRSSADIVAAAWPQHSQRISLEPHRLPIVIPAVPVPPPGSAPVIGVLGNINRAKGAGVLVRLSKALAQSGQGKLVLLGNIEPGFELAKPSRVTGSYQIERLPELIARHRISRWFFPAIWPETFSYATHEMIATGLPVWCFDIGAPADAIRGAAGIGGGVIPLRRGQYDLEKLAATLTETGQYITTAQQEPAHAE